FPSQVIST
ncbi:hypothetical protein BVRB_008980, partial [Beta vulgaris subsp. vulgaris]